MAGDVKVQVKDGWAVFDGKQQRGGGETLTVPAEQAEQWERAGWVEPITKTARRKPTS